MTGTSADGSLRFENRQASDAGGRPTDRASTAWIWDAATGETLAEGTAWTTSRVTPQPDGTLLLALHHRQRDALFRLDPATRTFHTLGERRPDESLSQLAAAIDRAHRASMDKANFYMGVRLAPDGSLRIELAAVEWSNSHWVNSPRVIEVATGRVLLDLWNTDWDAEPSFPCERCVILGLRRYRSRIQLRAVLDLAQDSFTIQEDDSQAPSIGPLAEIAPALEAASRRAAASVAQSEAPPRIAPIGIAPHPTAPRGVAPRRTTPSVIAPRRTARRGTTPRQLVVALLILVGALATIAALSFIVLRLHPEPPQKLTPLPKMPDAQPPAINQAADPRTR